ncbi:MAG: TonB-dependent receptor [Proteobacteria bacterium]|nr:TonB-dependent receptor [Pseudomonadota bacterium]
MLNLTIRRSLMATTVLAGAVVASPSLAQDTAAAAADAAQPEIIITGSRIPQPNLNSVAPVSVVGAQDVKISGVTRVEDLLNSMPQVFAAQGSNLSNGADGTATVNLRGLGTSRTLVLIDGKRLMPGQPGNSAADLNFIPTELIKRVDILTGGAGSVYGSDAVAGVVNFVMDNDYTGFKTDVQYGVYQHNNNNNRSDIIGALQAKNFAYPSGNTVGGQNFQASATFGAAFGDNRGHVTAYVTYAQQEAVLQSERDYSACTLAGTAGAYTCGGSSTSATGRFFLDSGASYTVSGNTFVPWKSAYAYNYGPLNYYQRPDKRITAGFFADYEITPAIKPYMSFMFLNDSSVAQIAPSGDFGNTLTVPCDNPFLSAQQLSIICAPANIGGTVTRPNGTVVNVANVQILRRNVEGGPRQNDLDHTDYRIVGGFKGELSSAWSYDAYYQYGKVDFVSTYLNDFSVTRLKRALDVTTSTTGQPVCASVLDGTDTNCVPWNVFAAGGVTSAATGYLAVPGILHAKQEQVVFNANITGDLGKYGFQSPLASDGVKVNGGFEYRIDSGSIVPDMEYATGDLAGQGGATTPLAGRTTTSEWFGELQLPLITDKPFFELLRLDGSFRHSKFSNVAASSNANSWKIAGLWKPIRDVMFRVSYNKTVRAANIGELFSPQSVQLDGSIDPCAGLAVGGLVNGYSAAQCARTGVTAAQFGNIVENSAAQYNGLVGGNPTLAPEVGKTFSAGVVLTPSMVPGLSLTVDYFNIKVTNLVGVIGADNIITQCLENNVFCSQIHRDSFGSLWRTTNGYIVDTNLNSGTLFTRGFDFGARLLHTFGFGKVDINMTGTYSDTNGYTPVGSSPIDCAGLYSTNAVGSCGTPTPKWRHILRATYSTPSGAVSITPSWRYFSGVSSTAQKISSQSYVDLTASFRLTDAFKWRLGINNLFDKAPPVVGNAAAPSGNGNTYPQVYDAMGRRVFVGVSMNF